MPYVKRDNDGRIVSVSRESAQGCEPLSTMDPELQAFLASLEGRSEELRHTDLDFVRVLEDLVELLVGKGVILFTELPESAQEKMIFRQRLRSRMAGALNLIGND
jgi:hypothetical protein